MAAMPTSSGCPADDVLKLPSREADHELTIACVGCCGPMRSCTIVMGANFLHRMLAEARSIATLPSHSCMMPVVREQSSVAADS